MTDPGRPAKPKPPRLSLRDLGPHAGLRTGDELDGVEVSGVLDGVRALDLRVLECRLAGVVADDLVIRGDRVYSEAELVQRWSAARAAR